MTWRERERAAQCTLSSKFRKVSLHVKNTCDDWLARGKSPSACLDDSAFPQTAQATFSYSREVARAMKSEKCSLAVLPVTRNLSLHYHFIYP